MAKGVFVKLFIVIAMLMSGFFAQAQTSTSIKGASPYFWIKDTNFPNDASGANWCLITVNRKSDFFGKKLMQITAEVFWYQDTDKELDPTQIASGGYSRATSAWAKESEINKQIEKTGIFKYEKKNGDKYELFSLQKLPSQTQSVVKVKIQRNSGCSFGWCDIGSQATCDFSFKNPNEPPQYYFTPGKEPVLK